MNILVIGGVSLDTIIQIPELKTIEDDMSIFAYDNYTNIGGTGAGKSLCLAALDNNITLVTSIGKDEYGSKIWTYFKEKNIEIFNLESKNSTTHTNLMHSEGKRVSIFTSLSNPFEQNMEEIEKMIINSDAVMLNINNFCRKYIPLIKKHKKLCFVDIHDYDGQSQYHQEFIDSATILLLSESRLKNYQEFTEIAIQKGKQLVIVTKGKNGYYALDNSGNKYSGKAYSKLKFVDSNGAGDAFGAGFLHRYLESKNIGESLNYGVYCGAISCSSKELFNANYNDKMIRDLIKKELV